MNTSVKQIQLQWLLRRTALAVTVGILVGVVGGGFGWVLRAANLGWNTYPWLLGLLPIAGLGIVFCYRTLGFDQDPGTNAILLSAQDGRELNPRQVPLIFLSTVLTHLTGGSAGREGAALQLGGGTAGFLARRLHLEQAETTLAVKCGMAAGFAALFGTPLTAAVFALEVAEVGKFRARRLFFTLLSSYTGFFIARLFGGEAERFPLAFVPEMGLASFLRVMVLGVAVALLAVVFCHVMHGVHHLYQRYLPNPYIRVVVAGVLILVLTLLVGDNTYNGAGTHSILLATQGTARPEAFAIKMLFTALTLGGGFKGGEIVPTLFVGSTFGCTLGPLLGLEGGFSAGVAMTALFAGCTNCPLAAVLLSYELFSGAGLPYCVAAIAVSFLLSGEEGLYSAQKHLYPL